MRVSQPTQPRQRPPLALAGSRYGGWQTGGEVERGEAPHAVRLDWVGAQLKENPHGLVVYERGLLGNSADPTAKQFGGR